MYYTLLFTKYRVDYATIFNSPSELMPPCLPWVTTAVSRMEVDSIARGQPQTEDIRTNTKYG